MPLHEPAKLPSNRNRCHDCSGRPVIAACIRRGKRLREDELASRLFQSRVDEVMSQFGTGKVDFKAVFAKLKSVGFNGLIMVEGVKVGATAGETTANARANREFLEKVLAVV